MAKVPRKGEVTQPVLRINAGNGYTYEVFMLHENQWMKRCDTTNGTWNGPALVYVEQGHAGRKERHDWVDDPDTWKWLRKLIDTGSAVGCVERTEEEKKGD